MYQCSAASGTRSGFVHSSADSQRYTMQQSSSYSAVLSMGVVVAAVLLSVTLFAQDAESAAIVDHNSEHFKVQQQSCSDLCGFCPSCNGFYCGEECICECRQAADDHVECISKIKENSDKLGLIYDVLIQLPKSNNAGGSSGGTLTTRFARSAAPGKHGHHHDMGHDEMATFRKVLDLIGLTAQLSKVRLPTMNRGRTLPQRGRHHRHGHHQ